MRKVFLSLVILSLMVLCLPARPAAAQVPDLPAGCDLTTIPGALVCNPLGATDWIIFVHGYVPAGAPPGAAWLQLILPGGQNIPQMVNALGYGFAAAEFAEKNGLAIQEGVADTLALANYLKTYMSANHIYLFGASEGGLITTLIGEGNGPFVDGLPNPINGAVSACGPNGDFRKQLDYFGDFRVLFDYFFHNVLPGSKWDGHLGGFSPVNVNPLVTADWLQPLTTGTPSYYQTLVAGTIANPANASKVSQLMRTGKAAVDPNVPATAVETALSVLNYDIVGINDATATLGVQPYTNLRTWYFGSSNDWLLNNPITGVERIRSNDTLINQQVAPYQTTGKLSRVLVTIHNTLDPQVPIWHQILYRFKVWRSGSTALYSGIPIARYGHCNFTPEEVVFAFNLMVFKSVGLHFSDAQVAQALPDAASQAGFRSLQQQFNPDDALNGDPPTEIFIPLITNP